jgi:general secretion pathway protein F
LLGGLAGLIVLSSFLLRQEAVRVFVDGAMARLPLIGPFLRHVEAARFCRTMGILVESGAVLPDALRAARRAAGNRAFKARLERVVRDIETGRGLSDAMRARGWFPALALFMIAAGERSGALGEMFRRSADQLEQDLDSSITVGLNLLEPAILLILGIGVGLIVVSVLLPILQLNTMPLG